MSLNFSDMTFNGLSAAELTAAVNEIVMSLRRQGVRSDLRQQLRDKPAVAAAISLFLLHCNLLLDGDGKHVAHPLLGDLHKSYVLSGASARRAALGSDDAAAEENLLSLREASILERYPVNPRTAPSAPIPAVSQTRNSMLAGPSAPLASPSQGSALPKPIPYPAAGAIGPATAAAAGTTPIPVLPPPPTFQVSSAPTLPKFAVKPPAPTTAPPGGALRTPATYAPTSAAAAAASRAADTAPKPTTVPPRAPTTPSLPQRPAAPPARPVVPGVRPIPVPKPAAPRPAPPPAAPNKPPPLPARAAPPPPKRKPS